MSLQKTLRIKRKQLSDGGTCYYVGRPYWNTEVVIGRLGDKFDLRIERKFESTFDHDTKTYTEHGPDVVGGTFATLNAALQFVHQYGGIMVTTRNILNPEAGDLEIALRNKGGCTDPGTEKYHCM